MCWIDTKSIALLSESELGDIRTGDCRCDLIADSFKDTPSGNLRASDPTVLPGSKLPQLCAMGAKYRPSSVCEGMCTDTRGAVFESVKSGVQAFAKLKGAEARAGIAGCMQQ